MGNGQQERICNGKWEVGWNLGKEMSGNGKRYNTRTKFVNRKQDKNRIQGQKEQKYRFQWERGETQDIQAWQRCNTI